MEKRTTVLWNSPNRHLIVAQGKSFYGDDSLIYVVYVEHRNYRKFYSHVFYDTHWSMERWEYSLEDAIKYAKGLRDQFIED